MRAAGRTCADVPLTRTACLGRIRIASAKNHPALAITMPSIQNLHHSLVQLELLLLGQPHNDAEDI